MSWSKVERHESVGDLTLLACSSLALESIKYSWPYKQTQLAVFTKRHQKGILEPLLGVGDL